MTMQPGEFEEEQWYPKLPEGYRRERMAAQQEQFYPPHTPDYSMNDHNFYPMEGGNPHLAYGMLNAQHAEQEGYSNPHQTDDMYAINNVRMPGGGFFPGQGRPGFPPSGGFFPGQGGPGFPPFNPGFPPGQQGPGFPPGGPNTGQQGPSGPPPNYAPEYPSTQLYAVDPGAIRGCLYRYTYVWLSRRQGFWFYPTYVGRTSVAGYRWRKSRRRWEYFGIDLNRIDSFTCF